MSTPTIKAEYDTLENVAVRFDQQSVETEKMVRTLLMMLEPLEQSGWKGEAAQAFFREMNDEVLPATNRLQTAFLEGGEATRQIMQVMRTAEEDAANLFQDDLGRQDNGFDPNLIDLSDSIISIPDWSDADWERIEEMIREAGFDDLGRQDNGFGPNLIDNDIDNPWNWGDNPPNIPGFDDLSVEDLERLVERIRKGGFVDNLPSDDPRRHII